MATQTLEFNAPSGLSLSCKLFAIGSDTVAATANAIEKTNDANRYSVEFTDVPAGAYRLNAFIDAVGGFANEIYDLRLETAIFFPRSENGDVAAIKEKTDQLTFTTPNRLDVSSDLSAGILPGFFQENNISVDMTMTLYEGDTTSKSIFLFEDDEVTPYSLSGKTVRLLFETVPGKFVAAIDHDNLVITGTEFNVVTFEIPSSVTSNIAEKIWALRDVNNGNQRLAGGTVIVKRAATKTS